MKFKLLLLLLFLALGANTIHAQDMAKNNLIYSPKHEIRLSISDGLTLSTSSFLGMGLADAITGTSRSDAKSSGVIGVGYRYSIDRFRVGADLGFSRISSKITYEQEKTPAVKENVLNFLILPTGEFVYYKRRLVELYGSAAVGVNMSRQTQTGMTNVGKLLIANNQSRFTTEFAFQVNPIAVRVGNDRIGGFLEAGLGYRGFITAGVSMRF
ncbi:hypothetical protein [Bacteroides neonati]|uniref:hypothetical protein n=1 Tax=Bacteroides neonati TaxID=1347393 RepID=UPI0004BC6A89|nr:hypothetical protein [Bacteroides neonati]